nr:MAG TPA: hypothetical protein [Caudoviricetes sp.]
MSRCITKIDLLFRFRYYHYTITFLECQHVFVIYFTFSECLRTIKKTLY